jgi:phosphoribosylanthranilate isomerase
MRIQFGAVGLYEDNQLLFNFDDFVHDDFFYVLIRIAEFFFKVFVKVADYLLPLDIFDLNIIQLHGSESPAYIQLLRSGRESNGKSSDCLIIKAFNIATADDFSQTVAYEGIADYFLFDTKGKSVGGNGEKFNWSVLADYTGNTPFLLSGGIGPDDAELVKAFQHPKCLGIDLNSRFEIAPALKDVAALRRFLTLLTP